MDNKIVSAYGRPTYRQKTPSTDSHYNPRPAEYRKPSYVRFMLFPVFMALFAVLAYNSQAPAEAVWRHIVDRVDELEVAKNFTTQCKKNGILHKNSGNEPICPAVVTASIRQYLQYDQYLESAQKSGKWLSIAVRGRFGDSDTCDTGLRMNEEHIKKVNFMQVEMMWQCLFSEDCCDGGCCEKSIFRDGAIYLRWGVLFFLATTVYYLMCNCGRRQQSYEQYHYQQQHGHQYTEPKFVEIEYEEDDGQDYDDESDSDAKN